MYASIKQARWAHTEQGEKALGGPAKVAEWDHATDFSALPMKVGMPEADPAHPHARRMRSRMMPPLYPKP